MAARATSCTSRGAICLEAKYLSMMLIVRKRLSGSSLKL